METKTDNQISSDNSKFTDFFEQSNKKNKNDFSKDLKYINRQIKKNSSPLKYNIGVNIPQKFTPKKMKYKNNNFIDNRNNKNLFIRNAEQSNELNNNKKYGIKLNYEINDYLRKDFQRKKNTKNKSKNKFLKYTNNKILTKSNSTANSKKIKSNQNLGLQLTLKTSAELNEINRNKLFFSSSLNNMQNFTNKTTNNISSNFSQTINTHNLSIKLPFDESMKNEILDILNLNNNIKINTNELNINKNITHSHSNKSFSFTKRKKPYNKNNISNETKNNDNTNNTDDIDKIQRLEKEIEKIKEEYNKIKYEKTNLETSNMIMKNEMKFFMQQKEMEKDNFEKYKQNEIKKLVDEKNKITKETETLNELKKKFQEENLDKDKKDIHNKMNNDKELIEMYKNKLNKANDEIIKLKNIINNNNVNIEDKKHLKNISENSIENIEHNKSREELDDESEDNDDDNYDLILPDIYHKEKYNLLKTEKNSEGTTIKTYDKNKTEINLSNGDKKEIYDDKYEIIYYYNGDIKQIFKNNNKQVFFFKKQNITKTTLNKGLQIIKYNNMNQLEKIFPNGTKKISFADGKLIYILPNGIQETYFPDGSVERSSKDNNINLEYENKKKNQIIHIIKFFPL